jgi:hypothetical protein
VVTPTQTASQPESSWGARALHGLAHRVERLALRVEGRAEPKSKPAGAPELFWPYGTRAAIVAVFVLWAALGLLAWLLNSLLGWPSQSSENHVFYVATLIGLLPLALVVLDVVARRGGAVDFRGFKIDFSASVVHTELQLAPNLGQPGPVVSDSAPATIIEMLRTSADHDAIRIDLATTWWLTRMLALSAGASRAGSPRAFIFVRTELNGKQTFAGWAPPKSVLDALLAMRSTQFQQPYAEAQAIAQQIASFGPDQVRPPLVWPIEVNRYLVDPRYNQLGLASLEHVLLDRLAPLEAAPEALDFTQLRSQLGDDLVLDHVESNDPPDRQLKEMFASSAPFIALLDGDGYKALMRREDAERDVLRQLAQPVQAAA